MPTVSIKKTTPEETILREYRHLRTVIAEERVKIKYLDGRLEQMKQKRADKIETIKANEVRFTELRAQAAKIMAEMVDEGEK